MPRLRSPCLAVLYPTVSYWGTDDSSIMRASSDNIPINGIAKSGLSRVSSLLNGLLDISNNIFFITDLFQWHIAGLYQSDVKKIADYYSFQAQV